MENQQSEGEYPFQETLMLEEAGEFDMPQTEVFLEDLTVRMINARKLKHSGFVRDSLHRPHTVGIADPGGNGTGGVR
ncbi:MAG: DUF3794 domain-containing protein [Eubacterium ramulus]